MLAQFLKLKPSVLFESDLALLVVLFIIFFVYAMYFGKSRIISFILAFYPATFLYKNFSYIDKLVVLKGGQLETLNKIGIFLIFFIPLNIIINRYIFCDSGDGGGGLLRNAGLALSALILIVLFSYNTINLDALHNFSSSIDVLFSSTDRIFAWNLAPFLLLAFL